MSFFAEIVVIWLCPSIVFAKQTHLSLCIIHQQIRIKGAFVGTHKLIQCAIQSGYDSRDDLSGAGCAVTTPAIHVRWVYSAKSILTNRNETCTLFSTPSFLPSGPLARMASGRMSRVRFTNAKAKEISHVTYLSCVLQVLMWKNEATHDAKCSLAIVPSFPVQPS